MGEGFVRGTSSVADGWSPKNSVYAKTCWDSGPQVNPPAGWSEPLPDNLSGVQSCSWLARSFWTNTLAAAFNPAAVRQLVKYGLNWDSVEVGLGKKNIEYCFSNNFSDSVLPNSFSDRYFQVPRLSLYRPAHGPSYQDECVRSEVTAEVGNIGVRNRRLRSIGPSCPCSMD